MAAVSIEKLSYSLFLKGNIIHAWQYPTFGTSIATYGLMVSLFDTNDELKYKKVGISEKFLCKGTRHDMSWVRQFVGIDHTHDRQQGAGRFIAMGKKFTAASVRQPTNTDADADVDETPEAIRTSSKMNGNEA